MEIKNTIKHYLDSTRAQIYGDACIGFRAQLSNGTYDDEVFGMIYEDLGGIEACDEFNTVCESLKSGGHNW